MPPLDGSLIPIVLLATAVLFGGTLATYAYDQASTLWWRCIEGACTGLAALGLVGFVLAMRFGLGPAVVAVAGVLVASPLVLLHSKTVRGALWRDVARGGHGLKTAVTRPEVHILLCGFVYVIGLLVVWRVADRTMFTTTDGTYTGVSHNLGDLPFHLSITNRFLFGDNFPPEHPSFAGASLTYPFVVDLLGAMFVRAGLPVRQMIVWSTFLLCTVAAALVYRLTQVLTGSDRAAFVAPLLALSSGGWGWWRFAHEAGQNPAGAWSLLAHLPHDYTITADNVFRWGNLVTTLLVTQRGLLVGLPLAILVLVHLWRASFQPDEDRHWRSARMLAAGVMTGLLPLVHAHTFGVVMGASVWFAVVSDDRKLWIPFFAWALALGVPQVLWMAQASSMHGRSFLGWSPGWDHGDQNIAVFWLKNTGLFLPMLVVALAWRGNGPLVPRTLLLFYLPFALVFLIANLFRLAPWVWDNIKVLLYWFVASVPLVALAIARLGASRWWRRGLAVVLVIALMLAGALDLWRVASGSFRSRIFDRQGMEFAAMIFARTSPNSLIVHAPVANHPLVLTGRRSYMGYPGHVWSHGLEFGPRESEIRRIYAGGPDADRLLAIDRIDYIVVGPMEGAYTPLNKSFLERYPLVGETAGYQLYRVKQGEGRRGGDDLR